MIIDGKYSPGIEVSKVQQIIVLDYFLNKTRYPEVTYWKKFQFENKWYIVDFQYNVYEVLNG